MASLVGHYVKCRKLLCEAAKRRETITYGALATALGLKSPRQEWSTVLGPIADDEVKKTGHDLTLVVVYAAGPAMATWNGTGSDRRPRRRQQASGGWTERCWPVTKVLQAR